MVDSLGCSCSWDCESGLTGDTPDTAGTLVIRGVASRGVVRNLVGADGDGPLVVSPSCWLGGIGDGGGHGDGSGCNDCLEETGAVG